MNMFAVFAASFAISLLAINSASSEINSIPERKPPSICGFKFAAIKGLEVTIKPISPRTLRNRVDNERYEACPYKFTVKYNQIVMPIDFGQDINLELLKEADQYGPVRAGYFQYDENGWGSVDEDIKIRKNEISSVETPDGVTVSAILMRRNQQAGTGDYCFSVVAISKEKYAIGAVCRKKKNQLNSIRDIFAKRSII